MLKDKASQAKIRKGSQRNCNFFYLGRTENEATRKAVPYPTTRIGGELCGLVYGDYLAPCSMGNEAIALTDAFLD